jgi:hypothetical protein
MAYGWWTPARLQKDQRRLPHYPHWNLTNCQRQPWLISTYPNALIHHSEREYLEYRASMSHHAFASLWMQLEKRKDIDNILNELVGRYSLESSVLSDDSDNLLNSSLSLAVVLRAIFDLQRTYLQCSRPASLYLLQPSKLLFAIIFLLRIKCRVTRLFEDKSEPCVTKRSFIAQTLVSGLRALWLWNYPLGQDKITQLRNTFQTAWKANEELNSRDTFLVRTLCERIVDELGGFPVPSSVVPPSGLAQPACGQTQLRDYSTGLVSILVISETIN